MEQQAAFSGGPLRTLLVGGRWDELWPCVTALEVRGRIALHGPIEASVSAERFRNILEDSRAGVIVVSAPRRSVLALRDAPRHPSHAFTPPVLQCLTQRQLASDPVHCDGDDFIIAPCEPDELELRLARLAERFPGPGRSAWLRIGATGLNPETFQVQQHGKPVRLAWMEFRLLKFLMENPGRVFTRMQLLNAVWDTNALDGTRTVDVHVRRLRHKLGLTGEEFLRTVKNVGYGIFAP